MVQNRIFMYSFVYLDDCYSKIIYVDYEYLIFVFVYGSVAILNWSKNKMLLYETEKNSSNIIIKICLYEFSFIWDVINEQHSFISSWL